MLTVKQKKVLKEGVISAIEYGIQQHDIIYNAIGNKFELEEDAFDYINKIINKIEKMT